MESHKVGKSVVAPGSVKDGIEFLGRECGKVVEESMDAQGDRVPSFFDWGGL